jgi:hypothetical protein
VIPVVVDVLDVLQASCWMMPPLPMVCKNRLATRKSLDSVCGFSCNNKNLYRFQKNAHLLQYHSMYENVADSMRLADSDKNKKLASECEVYSKQKQQSSRDPAAIHHNEQASLMLLRAM